MTWPDGRETKGIDTHITELKAMFVWAPDITIKVHPIRFGSGSWAAGTGVMTGTFSRPMPTLGGGSIAPTGKRFAISMATIGHWVNGRMDHEWLFRDNTPVATSNSPTCGRVKLLHPLWRQDEREVNWRLCASLHERRLPSVASSCRQT